MPVSANTKSKSTSLGKRANRVLDLSGGARSSDVARPAEAAISDADQPRPIAMSAKAQREARFQARHGDQGRYDEGLDVEVDRDDIHEVLGEAFANRNEQRVMKSSGTGASKLTPSYQSKPKSVRMHN